MSSQKPLTKVLTNTSIGGKISIIKQNNYFVPQFVESASQEGIFRLFLIYTKVITRRMLQCSVRILKLASLLKDSDISKVSSIYIRS